MRKLYTYIPYLHAQVLTKEQLYVKPSQSVPPASLPGGIKLEAVNSAATLPVIVKQVCAFYTLPIAIFICHILTAMCV